MRKSFGMLLLLCIGFGLMACKNVVTNTHSAQQPLESEFPFDLAEKNTFSYPAELTTGRYYSESLDNQPVIVLANQAIKVNWNGDTHYFTKEELLQYFLSQGSTQKNLTMTFRNAEDGKFYRVFISYAPHGNGIIKTSVDQLDGGVVNKYFSYLPCTLTGVRSAASNSNLALAAFLEEGRYYNDDADYSITISPNQILFNYGEGLNRTFQVSATGLNMNSYALEDFSFDRSYYTVEQELVTIHENGQNIEDFFTIKEGPRGGVSVTHKQYDGNNGGEEKVFYTNFYFRRLSN